MAPCKLGLKSRARVNSFSWARVKGAAEVKPNKLYCTAQPIEQALQRQKQNDKELENERDQLKKQLEELSDKKLIELNKNGQN